MPFAHIALAVEVGRDIHLISSICVVGDSPHLSVTCLMLPCSTVSQGVGWSNPDYIPLMIASTVSLTLG